MIKTIAVITATRAEYGLLRPIIKGLQEYEDLDVRVIATGAHLSPEFGLTYKDIEADGIVIDEKVEMLMSSDSPEGISKSMGLCTIGFAGYFSRRKPDLLLVLGDRYETIAVCCAAMNFRIPIAHMHGGETTEGAVDEAIRHAITKLSYLHFTSTQEYRKRVIQLGENPERVFCTGAIGVENALNHPLLSKDELEKSLGASLKKPFSVVTFHPVTLEGNSAKEQCSALLEACAARDDIQFIFTKANADADGRVINDMIDQFVQDYPNGLAFTSLGLQRYLSALNLCDFVMGNSSSGLLEAPSFGVPTINIGNRQRGRLQASSVLNCEPRIEEICDAIEKAMSPVFQRIAKQTINPYGDGRTSDKIISCIREFMFNNEIDLKKKFFDL